MRKFIYILLMIILPNFIFAQTPIFCTSVDEDGHVTINFQEVTSGFDKYEISSSLDDGLIYKPLGTINNSTTNYFTDNINDANKQKIKYELKVKGVQSYAETLFLKLTPEDDNIRLNWNEPFGLVGSDTKNFKIYRRLKYADRAKPQNDWGLPIADLSNTITTYLDVLPYICEDTVLYKIVLENDNGCESSSNIVSVIEKHIEAPDAPVLTSATVNLNTQSLELNWKPSVATDVAYYIVLRKTGISYDSIGKVDNDPSKSEYNFIINNLIGDIDTFAVRAVDLCGNAGNPSLNHNNIFLEYDREGCTGKITFKWNAYSNMLNGGVVEYIIMGNQDGSKYSDYAAVAEDGRKQYTHTITVNPLIQEFNFYIKARSFNDDTVSSNIVTSIASPSEKVKYIHIRSTEVAENNKNVDLNFYIDPSINLASYYLYRSDDGGFHFEKVGEIPYSGKNKLRYRDNLPIPASEQVYHYRVSAFDACGNEEKFSAKVSTIKLSLIDDQNINKNNLEWTPFAGWNNVEKYEVYRRSSGNVFADMIGTIVTNVLSFEDNLPPTASDRTNYYVKAFEDGLGVDGEQAVSISSHVSVIKESLIWVPNAFTPTEHINKTFKPECTYIREGSYIFKVYNRQGEVLFSTTSTQGAWDGTYKGRLCNTGTYVYYIECITSDGQKQKKSGFFHLIN